VHRILLSGPCTSSRAGENRSRSLETNPPERSAITVGGVGLGDGDGVSSRCHVPAGLEALLALMNVHSMHRPRGADVRGAADRLVAICGACIIGPHDPGGELYPQASTSVTDGGTVSSPSW